MGVGEFRTCADTGRRCQVLRLGQVAELTDTQWRGEAYSGLLDERGGLWCNDRIAGGVSDVRAVVAAFDWQRAASFLADRPGWTGPVLALTVDKHERRPRLSDEERRVRDAARRRKKYQTEKLTPEQREKRNARRREAYHAKRTAALPVGAGA